MIKIYVKDNVVDMLMLKELKKNFCLVYNFEEKQDIYLENNILHIKEIDFDLNDWIKELHNGRGENYSYFIEDMIRSYDNLVLELNP